MRKKIIVSCLGLALCATGFASEPAANISAQRILARTKIIASDEFEGRAPGTVGEEKTIAYLTEEFKKIGLQPGNPDGTFVQAVKSAGITSQSSLTFKVGTQTLTPQVGIDFIALSRRRQEHIELKDNEVIFVGYGVTAPEFGWDDFKDVDVRGKTVVMLINDPPVLDAKTGKLSDAVFGGHAMTYYGRWTYKFENASAHGAAAVLIVHETGPAGYPFAVIAAGSGRETFDVGTPASSEQRVAVEGWMTLDTAKQLFVAAGHDFAALKTAAAQRDFRPVPLGARAEYAVENKIRDVVSRNVVGLLPGSDAKLRDEYVVYSAHWDAYGRDPTRSGDQILNGAADNAIAIAMMLDIAEVAAAHPPRRSLLFFAPTYEEKGILGSKFYAENPLYPLERTAANINLEPLDAAPAYEPTRDLEIVGRNRSTIDDYAIEIAHQQDRVLRADSEAEKGYYYRSDHIEFAKAGVPVFFARSGLEVIGAPAETGRQRRLNYLQNDYHKISDDVRPDWTCEGAAHDARFLFALGLRIANADTMPEWKLGSEFKAIRDAGYKSATK
ncbi:M28 family peptidase [Oleiharenicola lentus]|uniref:M28 family peptidase n=1 Tax=Oleiharenicola lentus TaxID=2508720 RepID=UPI003F6728C1